MDVAGALDDAVGAAHRTGLDPFEFALDSEPAGLIDPNFRDVQCNSS